MAEASHKKSEICQPLPGREQDKAAKLVLIVLEPQDQTDTLLFTTVLQKYRADISGATVSTTGYRYRAPNDSTTGELGKIWKEVVVA